MTTPEPIKINDKPHAGKTVNINRALLVLVIILQIAILIGIFQKGRTPSEPVFDIKKYLPKTTHAGHAGTIKDPINNSPVRNSLPFRHPGLIRQNPARLFQAPFDDHFNDIHNEMNRMIEDAAADFQQMEDMWKEWDNGWNVLGASSTMDMREEKDSYVVTMSIPYLNASNITVTLEGQMLTVSSAADEQSPGHRQMTRFERKIYLPGPVKDVKDIQTVFTNNILKIVIPKADKATALLNKQLTFIKA